MRISSAFPPRILRQFDRSREKYQEKDDSEKGRTKRFELWEGCGRVSSVSWTGGHGILDNSGRGWSRVFLRREFRAFDLWLGEREKR
ncbi:hypothetical protein HNY73_007404 [Argiope bruennichi]|uniref:Uncharacterized protein n=1 Tax=Argiope bruennichi TaxID=94029 RepID=A0A8T0FJC4_ARGBR|nr:hypothetical protein HNY73_007404 [Argiope bruennichi]